MRTACDIETVSQQLALDTECVRQHRHYELAQTFQFQLHNTHTQTHMFNQPYSYMFAQTTETKHTKQK
jgi:hypothetical protein